MEWIIYMIILIFFIIKTRFFKTKFVFLSEDEIKYNIMLVCWIDVV